VQFDIFGVWQVSKRIKGFKLRPETTEYHKVCPKGILSLDLQLINIWFAGWMKRAEFRGKDGVQDVGSES